MITADERETYQNIWAITGYGEYSPGERYLPLFLDMLPERVVEYTLPGGDGLLTHHPTVLDAGTGSGRGALALQQAGFRVTCCDLTTDGLVDAAKILPFHDVCLWHDVRKVTGIHDWVFCCDVLEHVPTPLTMLTVHRLLQSAKYGVFLSIALVPDMFGMWIGKSLHQTVQSFEWWKAQLAEVGVVTEARDCLTVGVYLVTHA